MTSHIFHFSNAVIALSCRLKSEGNLATQLLSRLVGTFYFNWDRTHEPLAIQPSQAFLNLQNYFCTSCGFLLALNIV